MVKNKSFARYSTAFMILGTFAMFFYSGLQNDHLNLLRPVAMETFGYTQTQADMPVTWAGFAVVFFYLICGASLVKFGVRKILVPCTIILGLSLAGLGFSTTAGNALLYSVSLFLVRLLVVPLQMGGFMLAANWFIKYRGRVLGIITAGSPLFSILGIGLLTKVYSATGKLDTTYAMMGVVVILLAVCFAVFLKDDPEHAGLFPDGADHKPASEEEEAEEVTLKEILTTKKAWQLIISYGIMQFVINAMMAYMVARYIQLGKGDITALWAPKALGFLSVGAALGIPMSFVLGWIDDKLGTIKASIFLNLLFFIPVIALAFMPEGGNSAMMAMWAFGVACMTGGVPTMHPCSVSYVYGRRKYQDANKWIMSLQLLMAAFSTYYMGYFFEIGKEDLAYYGMLIMLVISLITVFTMWNIPDANAADRDYGK
jgi:MFS family permease